MKIIQYHIDAVILSFKLILKRRYFIYLIPGLIITLLFAFFSSFFGGTETVSEDAGWMASIFSKVSSILEFIIIQIYIFVILTLLSPFNTFLSEKLDSELTQATYPFNPIKIINDLIRMIFVVLLILLIEFSFLFFWWLFCWIFGIHDTIIYQAVTFVMAAFFFGFSFYDYSLERYSVNVFGSISFAFSHFFMVLLTGIIFKILYYMPYFGEIPYLGITIAPVLTTMISTIVYLNFKKEQKTNE